MNSMQQILASIANVHNKTPAQVALNWLISKPNVVAIPGAKKSEHVVDSAGAVDWRLTESEVEKLDLAGLGIRFDRVSGITNLLRAISHL